MAVSSSTKAEIHPTPSETRMEERFDALTDSQKKTSGILFTFSI
jgi:hypothetical protein